LISLDIHKAADGTRATLTPLVEQRNLPDGSALASFAWDMLAGTHQTVAGEPINTTIALSSVAVWSSVNAIASAIKTMPLVLYRRLPKGREEALDSPLHRVLTVEPNSDMSAKDMWYALSGHLALHGNCYAEILRNKENSPVGLYPLDPRATQPIRLPNGLLAYKTSVGATNGATRIINAVDMLHPKFFSWNGLLGLSPIDQGKNTVALAIAAEKYAAKFFGNNSIPPGLLTPVGEVSEDDLATMRTFWERANSATNQGRIGVLPSDWKLTQLASTAEQSQLLQTQEFIRTQIAGMFNISPSRIGDMQKQSKSSAEQENISFVTDTLQPYMDAFETEIERKLLPRDRSMLVQFDPSARLRGDFKTMMDGFAVGKQWGFWNTNKVLSKLGENPIGPEGDIYWAPVNMTNAENLLAPAADPSPEPLLDPPTGAADPQQRDLFGAYLPMLNTMFQDAVGRAAQRSKKDAETLTPIFTPLMESVITVASGEARKQFGLPEDWQPSDKIAKDYIRSAAARSATWTAENRNQAASQELYKATQAAHLGVFRDAGAAVAIRSKA
jgi:HK97 family phage portal protein